MPTEAVAEVCLKWRRRHLNVGSPFFFLDRFSSRGNNSDSDMCKIYVLSKTQCNSITLQTKVALSFQLNNTWQLDIFLFIVCVHCPRQTDKRQSGNDQKSQLHLLRLSDCRYECLFCVKSKSKLMNSFLKGAIFISAAIFC